MNLLTDTQKKIHDSAQKHFLAEGYQAASLRKIVAEAGFTLGAFYGYYDSKEELFDALVKETAEGIVATISKMGDRADAIPPEERAARMTGVFAEGLPELLDYLLSHKDETRLLIKCAAGTKYENFLAGLMDRDVEFVKAMYGDHFPLHPLAVKMLVNSYFMLLADAALSDEPREDIAEAMQNIQDVFAGGMIYLLKGKNADETV